MVFWKKRKRNRQIKRDPEIQKLRLRGRFSEKQLGEDKWIDFILFQKNKHLKDKLQANDYLP